MQIVAVNNERTDLEILTAVFVRNRRLNVKGRHIQLFILTILSAEESLRDAEVVVHTEADSLGIVIFLFREGSVRLVDIVELSHRVIGVFHHIRDDSHVQGAGRIRQAQSWNTSYVPAPDVRAPMRPKDTVP